jgi:hypothetical protein
MSVPGNLPGFTANRSVGAESVRRSNQTAGAPPEGVVAQVSWSRGYPPISMEECWQACINGIGECPPECAAVPWPTIPPPPLRYLRA